MYQQECEEKTRLHILRKWARLFENVLLILLYVAFV